MASKNHPFFYPYSCVKPYTSSEKNALKPEKIEALCERSIFGLEFKAKDHEKDILCAHPLGIIFDLPLFESPTDNK